jgi:hypothetical protein
MDIAGGIEQKEATLRELAVVVITIKLQRSRKHEKQTVIRPACVGPASALILTIGYGAMIVLEEFQWAILDPVHRPKLYAKATERSNNTTGRTCSHHCAWIVCD